MANKNFREFQQEIYEKVVKSKGTDDDKNHDLKNKKVFDKHPIDKKDHPLGNEDAFTGGTKKTKGKEAVKEFTRFDPKPMVASEALSAKQKKIDVDGDGEIEASDLAKLRKKGAKKKSLKETTAALVKKVEAKLSKGHSSKGKVSKLDDEDLLALANRVGVKF